MQLVCETDKLEDYLLELNEVDYSNPVIKSKIDELFHLAQTETEKIKVAFEFVRDEIPHSLDIEGQQVTCNASDVLTHKEGICYAKANLLAALLRSQGIPTGFCYQRLMLFNKPGNGHYVHAVNAVFIQSHHKWVRLDARGNKKGIDAQFLVEEEKLAFLTKEEHEEKDYPVIYAKPLQITIEALVGQTNPLELYTHHMPESL